MKRQYKMGVKFQVKGKEFNVFEMVDLNYGYDQQEAITVAKVIVDKVAKQYGNDYIGAMVFMVMPMFKVRG
jgi:hypothetical protein